MSRPIGSGCTAPSPVAITQWWEARRLRYNVALVVAGIAAFVSSCLIGLYVDTVPPEEFEITLFTILIQGMGYLLMMVLANLCYFLGPISETVVKPKEPESYRNFVFYLGTAFSVSLPFSGPACLAWRCFCH